MNFIFTPSLQYCAFVKIFSSLRIQHDISYIVNDRIGERWEYILPLKVRYEIQDKIIERVKKLQLPKSLGEKFLDFVIPMLDEILHWMSQHHYLPTPVLKKLCLCWTSDGRVDYKKTAEVLISYEDVDITWRYFLACTYCLESDIPKLWNKLPDIKKKYLVKESVNYKGNFNPLVHWTLYMNRMSCGNEITLVYISWQIAFESGLNKETTEYALQKLTHAQKGQSLMKTARKVAETYSENNSKILFFLLTQISEVEQMQIIETYPYHILKSLLYWPKQQFFLETAVKLFEFLPLYKYRKLSKDIIYEASTNKGYDYNELYREFWQQSPRIHRKYIFSNGESLIYELLKNKDEDNIKCILNDASLEDRKLFMKCRLRYLLNDSEDISVPQFNIEFPRRFEPELCSVANKIKFCKFFKP